jgi:hypothetical protein
MNELPPDDMVAFLRDIFIRRTMQGLRRLRETLGYGLRTMPSGVSSCFVLKIYTYITALFSDIILLR